MHTRARFALPALTLLISMLAIAPAAQAQYQTGDVLVGDNTFTIILVPTPLPSRIAVFRNDVHLRNLRAYTAFHHPTLLAIDGAQNVYFEELTQLHVMDPAGNVRQFAAGPVPFPTSAVFDRNGQLYVSVQSGRVQKYGAQGGLLQTYNLATSGIDAIDLASDQCTLFWVAGQTQRVGRYDVCTGTALADFATLPSASDYPRGIRVLPDGRVLIASGAVRLYSAAGAVIRNYPQVPHESFVDVALDPSGATFRAATSEGSIYRFNLATGEQLGSFAAGHIINGLLVVGEPRAALDSAAAIPVLDPIALVALAAMLAVVATFVLRR